MTPISRPPPYIGLAALLFLLVTAKVAVAQWAPPQTFPASAPATFVLDDDGPVAPLFAALAGPGASVTLVWSGQVDGAVDVYAVEVTETDVGAVTGVSAGPDLDLIPAIAAGSDGTLHAAWTTFGSEALEVNASHRPADGSWATPTTFSEAGGDGAFFPALAVDADGTAHVLYTALVSDDFQLRYRTRPPGGAWSAPLPPPGGTDGGFHPELVATADGGVHALWYRDLAVYYSRREGDAWTEPALLPQAGNVSDDYPLAFAAGADGTLHAVWYSRTTGTSVYGRREPGAAWTAEDVGFVMLYPDLAVDGEGRPHVVWEASDSPAVSHSVREGETWTTPGVVALKEEATLAGSEVVFAGGALYAFFSLSEGGPVSFTTRPLPTASEPAPPAPAVVLEAPYPNPLPSRSRGAVRFTLPQPMPVEVALYDVRGRRVRTLAAGPRAAGAHEVPLALDGLPAGVYFLRLQAGAATHTRPLTLLP